MLTHRNTIFVTVLLLAGLLAWDYSGGVVAWYWYALLLTVFMSIEFYGAYFVNSMFHLKTICKVDTSEKIVALTFDDGPMPERTPNVLQLLKNYNAKATFFCIGNRVKGNEALLKQMNDEGHLIGSHSYSHSNLYDFKNTSQMVKDLQLVNSEIKRTIGKEPLFFRPPYGVTTPALARASRIMKYEVIGWNVRSLDTSIKDKKQLVDRVVSRIKPGSILLFHDTVENIDLALEEILQYLHKNNYRIVELDKLIQKKAYA